MNTARFVAVGNYGCLETLASWRSHYSIGGKALSKRCGFESRELAQGDLNRISIEMIGQAAMPK